MAPLHINNQYKVILSIARKEDPQCEKLPQYVSSMGGGIIHFTVDAFSALKFNDDTEELDKALKKVGTAIGVDFILRKEYLVLYNPKSPATGKSMKDVRNTVAKVLTFVPEEICGMSRAKQLVLARHISIYIMYVMCGYSLKEIGREYKTDHTAIMHARDRIANTTDQDILDKLQLVILNL